MQFADHIREIENVRHGANTGRDDVVVESWRRCLEEYRLDPAKAREAVIVSETRLREHRQQAEDLVHIARSGLERLYRQVAEQNYVLLLSDRQGVTVEFLGDPSFNNNLRKAGLYLGAEWSEPRAGTCAVGACIATGEALTIHQSDHFDMTHTPLSCTAAPIYDMHGSLAAVLDISLLSSPILKASQNMARHLVSSTVRRIELANLMAHSRHDLVLRFAGAPEFLDVDPEAAISLDGGGLITGMTHGGARILASSCGLDWRNIDALIGQPVSRFFEAEVDDLASLTRSRLPQDRRIAVRDGSTLYVHGASTAPDRRQNSAGCAALVRHVPPRWSDTRHRDAAPQGEKARTNSFANPDSGRNRNRQRTSCSHRARGKRCHWPFCCCQLRSNPRTIDRK